MNKTEYLTNVVRTYKDFKKVTQLPKEVQDRADTFLDEIKLVNELGINIVGFLLASLYGIRDKTVTPTATKEDRVLGAGTALDCLNKAIGELECPNVYSVTWERFKQIAEIAIPPGFMMNNSYLANKDIYPFTIIVGGQDIIFADYSHMLAPMGVEYAIGGGQAFGIDQGEEISCFYFQKGAEYPHFTYIPMPLEDGLSLETFLEYYAPDIQSNQIVAPYDSLYKLMKQVTTFILNFLFLIQSKNMNVIWAEMNPHRLQLEKNIAEGKNVSKAQHQLTKIPSFKFVDVDLTVEDYTIRYRSQATGTGSKKKPHTRRAHFHTYWTGTEGNKKTIVKFIPEIWVGDMALYQEQTIIQVIR